MQEIVLLAEHPVDGIDYHLLQKCFINRSAVAGVAGGFQAAAAAPYDGLAASVVPVDTPVKLTALAAENDLCEAMLAGVAAPFAVIAGVDHAPADQLLLHQQEDVFRNDGLVVAFHVVLRDGAVVFDVLFCQEVRGVSLLQERVTDVLFVPENLVDGAGVPFCLARAGENAICLKPSSDLIHAQALQVFPVNAPDDFGLLRINDKVAVSILSVPTRSRINLIPPELTPEQISYKYANEADMLNVVLFGKTAKQWREENPGKKGNIRDEAELNQLLVLANMESYNAILIGQGKTMSERIVLLRELAVKQMETLSMVSMDGIKQLPGGDSEVK